MRNLVGNSTFYGDFKGKVYLTEGTTDQDIIVFELTYSVLPADEAILGNSNKKSALILKKKFK